MDMFYFSMGFIVLLTVPAALSAREARRENFSVLAIMIPILSVVPLTCSPFILEATEGSLLGIIGSIMLFTYAIALTLTSFMERWEIFYRDR